MARIHNRNRRDTNTWPGFVDALATMLLVVVFLLAMFVLAQFVLTQTLSGQDEALKKLQDDKQDLMAQLQDISEINSQLQEQLSLYSEDLADAEAKADELILQIRYLTDRAERAEAELSTLKEGTEADRAELMAQLAILKAREAEYARLRDKSRGEISDQEAELDELQSLYLLAQEQSNNLEKQLIKTEEELAARTAALSAVQGQLDIALNDLQQTRTDLSDSQSRERLTSDALSEEQRIAEATRKQIELLNFQLADLRKELAEINARLVEFETQDVESKATIADLGKRLNKALASQVEKLAKYRSDFFGRLREVMRGKRGVRIVGDRFVFQSEVLFGSGSATLGVQGQIQLTRLAETLNEIAATIPTDINWVLRVDGHTDANPINTPRFPSNWELSAARAIQVAKFLIAAGLPAERLAPTGFGEFHPIEVGNSELALRRNRRIEFKLTQR